MADFLRVQDGVAVEAWSEPEGFTIEECFTLEFVETFHPKGSAEIGWTWDGTEFSAPIERPLDDLKAAKIGAILTPACAAAIVGGYRSSALGTAHTYPSGVTDQINMMGSVTASLLPDLPSDWSTPFWCKDEAGEWAFRPHNAAQIQQAGGDGKAHVITCQSVLEQLSAAVLAASSLEEVEAVGWPN